MVFKQVVDVGNVIEVDDGTQFQGLLILYIRCVIGCKHDIMTLDTHLFAQKELGQGGTISPYP